MLAVIRILSVLTVALAGLTPAQTPALMAAELKPRTLQAFETYMRQAEGRIRAAGQDAPFLWVDAAAARRQQVRDGKILAEPWSKKGDVDVDDGIIHDWIGAVFIPGAKLDDTLALVQDYANHKNVYKPEVVDSRTVSHEGDQYKVFLRLLKKKVITVVLNTTYDVRYYRLSPTRCRADSYSERIAEVDNAGERNEREMPPGKDHGFLWRLNSFWRYEERDGGVFVECEAISLTRDVPMGLGFLINPIIRNLPKDSLVNLLAATRQTMLTRAGK